MRKTIGNIVIYFGIDRVGYVNGVNSTLSGGRHILMWDFDGEDKTAVLTALKRQQIRHRLSDIYVLNTNKEYPEAGLGNYHAYCFTPFEWKKAFRIVWDTPLVCDTYVKMAFVRGFFTLRFSKKNGRDFEHLTTLRSPCGVPEEINPAMVSSFVRYRTKQN